jgi:hypothetical protein
MYIFQANSAISRSDTNSVRSREGRSGEGNCQESSLNSDCFTKKKKPSHHISVAPACYCRKDRKEEGRTETPHVWPSSPVPYLGLFPSYAPQSVGFENCDFLSVRYEGFCVSCPVRVGDTGDCAKVFKTSLLSVLSGVGQRLIF